MRNFTFFTKIIITLIGLTIVSNSFAADINPAVLDKVRKSILTIDARISVAAYKDPGNMTGTGFIADKKNGLIVTNSHMVTPASIGIYFITFYNGKQSEAKVMYYDSWQDYAILKTDPAAIPEDVSEIAFSKDPPKLNDGVFIIGNNEAQDFSFHSGYLSNLYEINGEMPQHTYVVNLNVAGGSSGSPLINTKGEAIGLHYAGNQTFGMSLKGEYVTYALDAIKKGQLPVRKHIGAITDIYSLDKATNHRNFPKDLMEKYVKANPDSRNKAVAVKFVLSNSPAAGLLIPGDILWQVDGKDITSSLFVLDQAMNDSKKDKILLTIFRNGEKKDIEVPLYNVLDHQVKTLLDFAGGIIFEADDYTSAKTGISIGSVTMVNVQKGSGLSSIPTLVQYADKISYRLTITELDKHIITNLKSALDIMPEIMTKKFITVGFKNHQPYFEQFNNTMQSGHNVMSSDITLDVLDQKPRVMNFDYKTGDWSVEEVRVGK